LLNFQSDWNALKTVPLRPSRSLDSGGIFTFANGVRMEKLSRSVRRAKQVKNLMLTGQAVQLTWQAVQLTCADHTVLTWHTW
jgi:hypothetical protein